MENNRTWVPKVLLVLAVVLLLVALYFIFKPFVTHLFTSIIGQNNDSGEAVTIWSEEDGQSVDRTAAMVADLTGSLYFDSLALPGEGVSEMATEAANLYRYDLDNETTVSLVEFGESYDANPVDEKTVAFVSELVGEDGNRSAHVELDTSTGKFRELTNGEEEQAFELAVSAENPERMAYVFRSDKATEADLFDIKNYHIVFNNPYLGQTVILDQAASPAWLAEGEMIMFMQKDGVYLYDLQADQTKLVYDRYTDLAALNHLAVAASSSYAVMTLPALRTIVLLDIVKSEEGKVVGVEERNVITSDLTTYKTPVTSPDGRFYAVVAANETAGNPLHTIEVRHYMDPAVIKKITPEGVDIQHLNLSAWRLEPLQPLDESSGVEEGAEE